jgi:S-formylglutathione hydrolase FrmB
VLLTGDSMMMEGIGPQLQRYLKTIENVEVSRQAKYSTGLCRLDVFDWHEYFQSLLESFNPDLVVISLGGTDTQDLLDDKGRRHIVATEGWNEHYGLRVTKLLTLAAERGVKVIWIGLPIMGQEPYNGRAQNLNAVVSQVCLKALNCYFWDATGSLLNSSGLYSTFLTDQDGKSVRVRQKDAIHLTEAGGKMMLDDFLAGTNGQLFFGNEIPNFAHAQLFPQNPDVTYAQPKTAENQSRIQRVDNTAQAGPLLAPSDGTSLPPAAGSPDSPTNSSSPRIIQTYVNDRAQKPIQAQKPINDRTQEPIQAQKPINDRTQKPIQAQKPINPPLNTASNAASNELKGSPLETKPWLITETVLISPVRGNTTYLTITPELTSEDPRLPAVILLHGAEGNHKYFTNNLGSDLSDMAKRLKLIIIMPDGGPFGWYLDSPIRDESQIETYLINELLPDALSRFPIDPNKIAISGISMGGHGALSLALKYPGRFKAISSISGVIDLISHSSDSPLDKYLRLSEVLGPPVSGGVNWRGHSTYHLTRNAPGRLIGVPIKLSVGLNDKLCLAENRQYDRLLTELNLEHEYSERSGGHDWDLFRAEFSSHLEFLAEKLSLISSQK